MSEIGQSPVQPAGARSKPAVSFEFFPPKTEEMERALWEAVRRLAPLSPQFVSVTYGAGGSTRERTHATITRLIAETTLVPAAHLTCVDASRAEVDAVMDQAKNAGAAIVKAAQDTFYGGYAGYFQDPDAHLWEISWNPKFEVSD
jgi:methylenetetrahydrofolate reductase (NADPH)